MPPRTILYTGKGGVGKTSVAAATAGRCADSGKRTLVLSTDPAHSLSDSLEIELGPEPIEVRAGLWGQEVTAITGMRENWDRVSAWMAGVLASQGVDRVRAEELTVPPGMDELFSLLEIKRHWDSGEFDVLIIDCAPTGETLKLLGFPEIARWWMDKVFPWNRTLLGKAAPLAKALDISLPDPEMIEQVEDLVERLVGIDEILKASDETSIRLVMNPDRMVIDEARRTFTHLCLYGYRTDAVVVNRIFPDEVEGTYFDAWRTRQEDHLREVGDAFAPITVLTSRYFDREVRGVEMQAELAGELFGDLDPAGRLSDGPGREVVSEPDRTVIRIAVPFVEKGDLGLRQEGDELIVTLGDLRRTIMLPSGLRVRQPTRAALEDGKLEVVYDYEDDQG
jgi:arsenite-transporting ATPase